MAGTLPGLRGLAFWFALGDQGVLFPLVAKLPVFDKLADPFKFLSYLNVLVIMGSSIAADRILRTRDVSRWKETILGLAVIGLIIYHCSLPLPAFYLFGDKPYPRIGTAMLRILAGQEGRAIPHVQHSARSQSYTEYALALRHAFAAVYRVSSFDGRDPCVNCMPETCLALNFLTYEPREALKAYGVKWLIAHTVCEKPVLSQNPASRCTKQPLPTALEFARGVSVRSWFFGDVQVYEVPAPDPMAFECSSSRDALPVTLHDYDCAWTCPTCAISGTWWSTCCGGHGSVSAEMGLGSRRV